VHAVRQKIKAFSSGVRVGAIRGFTGKKIDTVVSIGIGGSYLGPDFVNEALKRETEGRSSK
jgi:glucose-6-phosphate isomerase